MEKINTKLGEFTFSEKDKCYELKNEKYNIVLNCNENDLDNCQNALNIFRQYENKIEELDLNCRNKAAKELIETANSWLEDADEKAITEEIFAKRINNPYFYFENNGTITVYYDDDDIFWGHSICVSIDENGIINYAEMMG